MKLTRPKLGLYSRFFILFSVTTVLLAASIALGSFTFSEKQVKDVILERHDRLYEMMTHLPENDIDLAEMQRRVKEPKVELKVTRGEQVWTTRQDFPDIPILLKAAEPIGSLYFAKHQSKYYLLAQKDDAWVAATALIANLLVYPSWLVYWPWLVSLLILVFSYAILRAWLKPVADALTCAQKVSLGDFKHRITQHPKTELAELTLGLNKMTENLQQLFDSKNELLLAISHELRTPMARMKISLAMLSDSDNANVQELNNDIRFMDELIEQLLEGERLAEGHKVLHLSTYYLPSLVDEVLQELPAPERITLVEAIPEEAITVDVGRIKFLLRNLLRNSLDHCQASAAINLSITQSEQVIALCVTDTGPGICEEDLPHIFEPFFCAENIKHRSTKGVGLGLYLCQKIALAHQGSLTVTSELGKGTQFLLTLPLDLESL